MWTLAIRGTVPGAEIIGAVTDLLHTPPSGLMVHVVDASIIGAQLQSSGGPVPRHRRANLPLHQPADLNWVVEGLRRVPRRVGRPHYWVLGHRSHLAAGPLMELDPAAAHAKAPPVHLMFPKEHATLLVPHEGGVLEPHVSSTRTLQQVNAVVWDSLAALKRVHTPLAGACEVVPLGTVHHRPTHWDLLRARDGRLPTMQVMRRWRQKITRTVILALLCIFCARPEEDTGHLRILCKRDEAVARLLCAKVDDFAADLPVADRAMEFMSCNEHGCTWMEALIVGVATSELKRLFAAVGAASSRGPA